MARNPSARYNLSLIDFSNEPASVSVGIPQYNLATNNDLLTNKLPAFTTAILDVSLLNKTKDQIVFFDTKFSKVLPTDPNAQREDKWFVRYQDNVNFSIHNYEIPGADRSIGMIPGTDLLDLTGTEALALIAASNALVLSPDGNATTILDVTFVGRPT